MPSAARRALATTAAAAAAAGTLLVPGTAATAASPASPAPAKATTTAIAVPNGGFEATLGTWDPVGTSGMWRAAPHAGSFSLGVFARSGRTAAVQPTAPLAQRAVKWATYTVTAQVSVPKGSAGSVELVETAHGKVVGTSPVTVASTAGGWTRVTASRVARSNGGTISLRLGSVGADQDRSVRYDAVQASVTTGLGSAGGGTGGGGGGTGGGGTGGGGGSTGSTLFGATVHRKGGEPFSAALANSDQLYGKMDVYRVFHTGLPAPWPGAQGLVGAPVVVSFKAPPLEVTAGKHDAYFTQWFASVPAERQVWWSYWHEPEDDAEAGRFTPAQYRAAWAHLDALAAKAAKPKLRSTLILMCWSLEAGARRDWKQYYPGALIDTLGWDCYNPSVDKGVYAAPETRFRQLVDASKAVGKPFAIAEFGSRMAPGDGGARRAAWLKDVAAWMRTNGAEYVTYFDANVGGDFRLLDAPSQQAWRWVVANS